MSEVATPPPRAAAMPASAAAPMPRYAAASDRRFAACRHFTLASLAGGAAPPERRFAIISLDAATLPFTCSAAAFVSSPDIFLSPEAFSRDADEAHFFAHDSCLHAAIAYAFSAFDASLPLPARRFRR